MLPDDQKLGVLTHILFDNLLYIFQLPDFGVLIAGVLFLFAVLVAIYVWLMSWRHRREVKRLYRYLASIQDRGVFTERYESARKRFNSSYLLRAAWQEFEETLILPPESTHFNDIPRYRFIQNTRRPHDYFNADVVHKLHVKSIPAASTFVGIGLVITFMGLVAALTEASLAFSVETTNGDAIEAAIAGLLTVAGAKFFASIGGLLGSILIAGVQSLSNNAMDKLTLQMCDVLEHRLWFVTPTHIAADQYEHAVRQTTRLEKLADTLAVSIGEQFKIAMHSVPGPLADAIEQKLRPVVDSINVMAEKIAENAENSTSELARQAAQEFGQTTRDAMNDVGSRITEVCERIEKATQDITTTQEAMSVASSVLAPILDKSVQTLQSSETVHANLEQIVNQLNESTGESQKQINAIASLMQETIERLEKSWSQQSAQLDLADAELEKAFEKVLHMLERASHTQQDQFDRMDKALANIHGHLKTGQSDLSESIEDLSEVLGQMPWNGRDLKG